MRHLTFFVPLFNLIQTLIAFEIVSFENCSLTPEAFDSFEIPVSTVSEDFQVIELDSSTGARCLDGSNYKFLYSAGSGSGAHKFLFNWIGGAFCGVDGYDTLESCYYRSKGPLGSSKTWGENNTIVQETESLGYFSSNKETNPSFWDWNKVMIKYCDGSNHQGYTKDGYLFNNTKIWFRGFNNTFSTFEHLKNRFNLFEAKEIVVSGGSAGGQATYIWSSYLQDYFPKSIKFMSIPDAGLFLDVYNEGSGCYLYRYLNQKIANLTNSINLELFRRCKYKGEEFWKCLMAEYIWNDIETPVFVVNSQDDSEAMRTQFGIACAKTPEKCNKEDKDKIADFRQKFLNIALSMKINKKNWGFWLRTCFNHVYQSTEAWYGEKYNVFNWKKAKSYSLKYALNYWYNNGLLRTTDEATFIDLLSWEENPFCMQEFIEERKIEEFYGVFVYLVLGLIFYAYFVLKVIKWVTPKKTTDIEQELI